MVTAGASTSWVGSGRGPLPLSGAGGSAEGLGSAEGSGSGPLLTYRSMEAPSSTSPVLLCQYTLPSGCSSV